MKTQGESAGASFCPYCGKPTELRAGSAYPYCAKCSRYIFPLPEEARGVEEGPEGIGGWLVLPAIGAVLNPIGLLIGLVRGCSVLTDPSAERVLSRYPGLYGLALFELVTDMALLGLSLWLASAFFGKRTYAPALYILYLAVHAMLNVILAIASVRVLEGKLIPDAAATAVATVIAALIWIPYFRVSRRVKATFVN